MDADEFLAKLPVEEQLKTVGEVIYESGVDDHLIQEKPGETKISLAVRNYKRTADVQKKTASDIVQGKSSFK